MQLPKHLLREDIRALLRDERMLYEVLKIAYAQIENQYRQVRTKKHPNCADFEKYRELKKMDNMVFKAMIDLM